MEIEKKVNETIVKYKLLSKKDRVVVALSGGKDSTSILFILHKLGYNVEGLMIDLHLGNWSQVHKKNMEKFCLGLGVKFHVADLKQELGQGICFIKSVLKKKKNLTGCAVCGTIKRWILNKHAKKLRADKLVTGHNLDDEAQNVLMNFLKGNISLGANSGPATGGGSVGGFVQRVKPLFFVPENNIREYAKKMKFDILYDRCPCAFETYRVETRGWIKGVSDKEKMKIVIEFQKLVPGLRKEYTRELRKCKVCGEPCSSVAGVCNACQIFQEL
tara:strand:- start:2852 stop:3670 length:819 start_codon:yes stop_codon:yes gene_type:complete